jgi:hypothetical protein
MEQLAGAVCPVGTCQINTTSSEVHKAVSMNAPFNYSTRCDDYVATIPDSTFQSGSITVVLTSCADVWVNTPVVPATDPPTADLTRVLRTNVPLLVNSTSPENGTTIKYSQYEPLNLPYTMVLSLEEA